MNVKSQFAQLASRTTRMRAVRLVAGLLALGLLIEPALAALPSAIAPAAGVASGDYIALIQQYWKKGVAALVLIIGAIAFFTVGGGAVAKFNEYRIGRAEVGDLTMYAILGVITLVIVVYLLTTADGIL